MSDIPDHATENAPDDEPDDGHAMPEPADGEETYAPPTETDLPEPDTDDSSDEYTDENEDDG